MTQTLCPFACQVEQLSGINETNLRNAIERALHPEEAEEAAASS